MTFDPLVEERVAPNTVVARSGNQNPLIVPRGETEAVEYTRASSLAGYLTYESSQISKWRSRYQGQGVARHKDLAARIAAVYYSTGPLTGTMPIEARKRAAAEIDECLELAAQRMGIDEAANMGTAGHSLTEPGNQGQVPDELVDVVKGYNEITAAFERVASEVFVVCDELRTGGTFDSAYLSREFPGFVIVGDTKTGKNYHQAEFEMQLATYAHGEIYQGPPVYEPVAGLPEKGVELGGLVHQRLTFEEYFGLPVNLDVAYLVHVSITGSPKPRVVKLDLQRGWRRAKLAAAVRDERIAIDKTGIGEKVDHIGLAKAELEERHHQLLLDLEIADPPEIPALREYGLTLYHRFKHVWTAEHANRIKRRLP